MDYKKQGRIDLHIHSTASDGSLAPSEILSQARKLNLQAIAITDHDTIEGSKEAIALGIPSSVDFLTGVEITSAPPPSFSFSGSFHLLGYGIRIDNYPLNHALKTFQNTRKNRNIRIIERLNSLGINISLSEVLDMGSDGQIGRPHIAQAMVKKNIVSSIDDAFDKYLSKGNPGYVDKYRIDCAQAIELILNAGGIPVLAHPVFIKTTKNGALEDLIVTLKAMGLKGIEVYYPDHTPEDTAYYADLAKRHSLLMTGGTDFHGSLLPDVQMGSGRGNLFVSYELYEKLIKCLEKTKTN